MRLKKIISTISVAVVLAGGAISFSQIVNSNVNVSAASKNSVWKKGVPKALLGKYETKHFGADLVATLDMRSNTFVAWQSGMPSMSNYNVKYKVIGHNKYTLLFDTHAAGFMRASKNQKMTITKISKTSLKVKMDKHIYHKVKKFS